MQEEPQLEVETAPAVDASSNSVVDLAEWIIPATECGEGQRQEAPPPPVSEIAGAETPLASSSDTDTEPHESEPVREPSPFAGIPATPARRVNRSDKEGLGQLAFDFGDSGQRGDFQM